MLTLCMCVFPELTHLELVLDRRQLPATSSSMDVCLSLSELVPVLLPVANTLLVCGSVVLLLRPHEQESVLSLLIVFTPQRSFLLCKQLY